MSIVPEIIEGMAKLDDWELIPVLALIERLLEGQHKYGPGRKERDWLKEAAEEAIDLFNYYQWSLHDRVPSGHQ